MSIRDIMTAAEAAEYLQIHIKTLYEWVNSGELPVVKLGPRSTRIRKVDLDQFLESRMTMGQESVRSIEEKAAASAPSTETRVMTMGQESVRSIEEKAAASAPSTATRETKQRVIK